MRTTAVVRSQGRRERRRRAVGLGVVAVAALLGTAACGGGSDDAAGGGKTTSAAPSATDSAAPGTTSASPSSDAPAPSPSESSDPPKASPSTSRSGGGSSEVPLCDIKDLAVTATNYDPKGQSVRHILIVATNTSGKKCDLQGAPEVTLGNAKGHTPVKQETDPGEVLTLTPGGKAYAGLLATGGHMDTYDVTSMKLGLGSPGGEAEPGKPVAVRMPVRSFPADDGQRVTYWAGTEGLAMRPVTSS
ncbi:DUF4232 domain-containing protein [Streptomyces sp. NPDC090025]|uniref:DUF4232 domain-containing protein n=1 Tax=Streptomyces sp. NPDC090025 TaxID=3365922 RepID=UPI0038387ECF